VKNVYIYILLTILGFNTEQLNSFLLISVTRLKSPIYIDHIDANLNDIPVTEPLIIRCTVSAYAVYCSDINILSHVHNYCDEKCSRGKHQ
jgi:hypothetical protein